MHEKSLTDMFQRGQAQLQAETSRHSCGAVEQQARKHRGSARQVYLGRLASSGVGHRPGGGGAGSAFKPSTIIQWGLAARLNPKLAGGSATPTQTALFAARRRAKACQDELRSSRRFARTDGASPPSRGVGASPSGSR